ncbi:MAG: RHS repeat-associated core domain-containing protein [Thermodesulfobacteriota bacterium]|nr:RHS repeat-associated core domain-containing protein [Thermodesulfobacteriota bacterium]
MILYKKSMSWIVIVTFFVSLFAGTGALYPKAAFAYDAPPKDQGHRGPNTDDPPPKTPPEDPCQATGSPVHIKAGNYFYSNQDLFIPGRGFSLQIVRDYDSQNEHEGPFGYGWSFQLLMELIRVTEGDEDYAIVRRGDGVRLKFKDNGDGTFTPPAGRYDTLVQNADGSYDLMKKTGTCSSCAETAHFDTGGHLLYKRDGNGNQVGFSYDGTGRVATVTDASGRQLTFSYGANNKISKVTDPAGREFSYTYDASGNLASYSDPLGNTTTYAYDGNRNLTSIVDPHGNPLHTITYDSSERASTYTEKGGTWQLAYYPDSNRTHQQDPNGNNWQYYYNDTGQMTQKRDPIGNQSTYTWDDNQNWTGTTDARGYTTSYTYYSNGNRLTETDSLGNTTTYTYDAATDKVATITDPMGCVTSYEYDSNGNRTKIIRDYGGSLQNETVLTYDDDGLLTSTTDPIGNTTTYTYDGYGNLIQVTDALGNATTYYTYDVLGSKLTETDSRGYTTTYGYDLLGRLISVKDALDNTTTYSHDASGNLVSMTDPAGNTVTYAHDSYNQLIQITDPLGNITQYAYDARGNRTGMTDANGNSTTYTYNAVDQFTSETNALGHVTSYMYDGNGNRLTVTDANGNTTTNTYDALNRVTRTTYPDSSFETATYDAVGNIIGTTDRNGNTVSKTYDALNRLLAITYPDGTATNYAYDLNGNILSAVNSDISYSFAYNALNRVTQVNNVTLGKSVSYSYLCCGLKNSLTNPEGGITSYTYDALKRLASLNNSFGETTTYTYDNLSRITKKDMANGSYTNYSYDAASRLTSLVNMTSSGSVISSYAYSLDNIGNRTSMTTSDGTHNYSYDNIYQVLQAAHPASSAETYTYDPVHNRLTSADHNDWTYDSNNRLISYNGFSYTYDANGNMISKTDTALSQVASYQYDYENKLKRINYPDGTYSEYRHDPFGNRIKKVVNGTVTWFVYDLMKGMPDVIGEYDSGGALVASYIHGPDVDEVISMRSDGNSYYYFRDGLGTVTSLNNNNEGIVNTYEYDAFGNVVGGTESVTNPYGFTGRLLDNESGLMYYRTRYYDASIGRFISADPIGFIGGINFYAYVLNNPVNIIDPVGLKRMDPECVKAAKKRLELCKSGATMTYEWMMKRIAITLSFCKHNCDKINENFGRISCYILCEVVFSDAKALLYLEYMATIGSCYGIYAVQLKFCELPDDDQCPI